MALSLFFPAHLRGEREGGGGKEERERGRPCRIGLSGWFRRIPGRKRKKGGGKEGRGDSARAAASLRFVLLISVTGSEERERKSDLTSFSLCGLPVGEGGGGEKKKKKRKKKKGSSLHRAGRTFSGYEGDCRGGRVETEGKKKKRGKKEEGNVHDAHGLSRAGDTRIKGEGKKRGEFLLGRDRYLFTRRLLWLRREREGRKKEKRKRGKKTCQPLPLLSSGVEKRKRKRRKRRKEGTPLLPPFPPPGLSDDKDRGEKKGKNEGKRLPSPACAAETSKGGRKREKRKKKRKKALPRNSITRRFPPI